MVEVRLLCYKHGCTYLMTTGTPGTKNGLYWSLKIDSGDDLHLCDDVALAVTNWYDLPPPCNWWLISYFAAYERRPEKGWWRYPTEDFYAALACRFHPDLRKAYIEAREAVRDGLVPETGAQDDILIKELIRASGKQIWNTGWDFAQHTGVSDSTFTGPHDCAYRSKYFIAERR
ncbi:hypothetical protein [Tetrasphaera phage TJE1]|uniref:Uncharacterized protein n=1 Tax=Tetrasphaera phage TJE1 TaxID=981335 RepID=G4W945_9CAUD|nr:hypothetical protein G185_gp07 [Tetrasphaera phage TJE1]ADX42533.1 hypothetical protein [Tetrasphaera phage TJE1]